MYTRSKAEMYNQHEAHNSTHPYMHPTHPCSSCATSVPSKSPADRDVDSIDSSILRDRLNFESSR